MRKGFLIFFIAFLCINQSAVTQPKDTIPETMQVQKIKEFIKQLRKDGPRMIYDYFFFFGEKNDREIALLRNKCKKDSLSFQECIELGKKVYCNPFSYESLVFKAIEEDKLGIGAKKLHPEENPEIMRDTTVMFPSAYFVKVKSNTFVFKMTNFMDEGNFILDIVNGDGKSVLWMK